ncbi:NAD(P)-binding domain-containing protein [Rhodococcus triatomae]|uniref:Predicted flavoprotein CzcO associated with the cation diffusion facilitator CzcD n=1 Tax=Rhodococcus triatomae TaxID=300028 RepID=A0A1G7ZP67_9NOCA|nr:NAD(P)-binding domain-containing protein [Rhodococcus triatomae]QNG17992.1 NAD(P)-binding domain-containing protein [Rhodococcus triatomae]QNG22340.1 NAD(P)-binding domain-containing protein [Rhodococcus triatomae]SDH10415.1 Predicted flavoprotein CzcO associated with the cation diffusion facilitator CzcD [Rhodococcus triatomae]
MTKEPTRFCIIGAGYAGLGVARAFTRRGVPYDHLEATDHLGGNWAHGVYDSTSLISSKNSTQYPEYPMPEDYPTFPSRAQMLRYLDDYADHFGLRDAIEWRAEVVEVRPLDRTGAAGWSVRLSSGEERRYAGVVVANGHYWEPNIPHYPGTFTGRRIHSKHYKCPADLGGGNRVLVVGGGNSASDLAVEAAATFGRADISMRRGYWFIPKTIFGIPSSEWDRFPLPMALQRTGFRMLLRLSYGDYRRYGLDRPDHALFTKDVTVNSSLMYALQHGKVARRPAIDRFDGETVHFVDGTCGEYDTIVWATGYHTRFPFLDESMFTWENGQPLLVEHTLVPRHANIYIWGLVAPRSGAGRIISRGADFLAEAAGWQRLFATPLADIAASRLPAQSSILAGSAEILTRIRRLRRMLHRYTRTARKFGIGEAVRAPTPSASVETPTTDEHEAVAHGREESLV